MNLSFLYGHKSEYDPTNICVVAVPTWMQISLKAQGKTLESLWTQNPGDIRNIMSSKDVMFHDDVTAALENYLFGTHKYGTGQQEAYEHLRLDWHLLPFENDCELNLHPVIMGSNLIGIVHLKGEDAVKVCETDIYERLLRCYHKLAVAQLGTKVWQSPLARAIIERIQSASQVA